MRTSFLSLALLATLLPYPTHSLSTTPTKTTPTPITTPVIICPGFGNDLIDYYEPLSQPYSTSLHASLTRRGFTSLHTVPVKRTDWIRVAGGLFDPNFYSFTARPDGFGYGWYVDKLKKTVEEVYESSGGEKVILLGHSAGGWLARAAMGDGEWNGDGSVRTAERVRGLVTVGAIHRPPREERECVTRGVLAFTDEKYPGTFLRGEGVRYVSVGGDAVLGERERNEPLTEVDELYQSRGEGGAGRVAYTSYKAVSGEGEGVTGDGVVPLEWSMLEGARQIRLQGVVHSINEAGTGIPTDRWYGSEGVVDKWLPDVLEEMGLNAVDKKQDNLFDLEKVQNWAEQFIGSVGKK